jgi:hypothetical protein
MYEEIGYKCQKFNVILNKALNYDYLNFFLVRGKNFKVFIK